MIRMGLLGAGRIGRIHGHNVAAHPGAELVAVADALMPAAEALAAETSAKVASIDAIIADRNIDAVLICTPDRHAFRPHRGAQRRPARPCSAKSRSISARIASAPAWPS